MSTPDETPAEEEQAFDPDFFSEDDLEAAYQNALAAFDEAEEQVDQAWRDLASPPRDDDEIDAVGLNIGQAVEESVETVPQIDLESDDLPNVSPRQVVEALLFVGGQPLTAKRIAGVVGGRTDANGIEALISAINEEYERQRRPYRIRLVEGGYVLNLTHEYEPVRTRVYGFGPREITLSQDAIEMLALIAYHQPVGKEKLLSVKDGKGMSVVRQLLRRDLVSMEKTEDGQIYRTTPRFLDVFALSDLAELPIADDLAWK